ncbi:hypothetical protein Lqui_1494 [Legionella quinlivanii]|uniref:YetF C-terminal domain-containing protein n=1 Tax=Legionella quinlivanii TaxID=45073 RepID=A0A0W0XZW5_9GAMM|nr:YetF domain-containing protein [Legionella quinlivanii]KTD50169.1 hypothetical protein Lqui_1494 [Legionella quinlivanii]MCW8450086.1 DUF421 domain-containing protein [Legionella quinlivanii]SEF48819.1 Protein of unknown function [Legionella quinlivanii DSM 21216]STY11767.1 Protein of uncharacterised function (DUF421) [Legionella quinlivanii]
MDWMIFLEHLNEDQAYLYMIIRAVLLFLISTIALRYGNRRFNLQTSFDYLLLIILGGLISRGINGSATLLSTLIATFTLMLLHRIIAMLTLNFETCEHVLKGRCYLLFDQGEFLMDTMNRLHITENDLIAEMRRQLNTENFASIEKAYLERTGSISFVCRNSVDSKN